MRDWLEPANRRDGVTVPTIWIAVALSVLLHAAIMWRWLPKLHFPSADDVKLGESQGALVVQLAPLRRPAPEPSPPPVLQSQPAPRPRPRAPPPPPPPAAPVIALKAPAAAAPSLPVPVPVAPAPPPQAPLSGDFAADMEARRRARGESSPPVAPPPASIATAPPAEDERTRANRIAMANLAQRKQTFGYDPSQGGGLFQIMRVGVLDAEFLFFGWDKNIRRNTKQLIEVRKGNNPDTRIAVVRRMIALIREYEQQDFLWESQRLSRSLWLSARAKDNAELEAFLMLEFFPEDPRVPR